MAPRYHIRRNGSDDDWQILDSACDDLAIMKEESYQVVNNVAWFLNNPEDLDNSECAEVAKAFMG